MKIKAVLIITALVIGAGVGTSYLVRRSYKASEKTIEVVPVTSVNSAYYGMSDSGTVSGTIISKDTQVVSLDGSHELVDVYVQAGDKVKKGDKLLEYDMLQDELKAEMEELTKLGLELSLKSMKKDLETMKSGRMPDYDDESSSDGSDADVSWDDDDDDSSADSDGDDDDDDESGDGAERSTAGLSIEGDGGIASADTMAEPSAKTGAPRQTWATRAVLGTAKLFADSLGSSQPGEEEEYSTETETESELPADIVSDDDTLPDGGGDDNLMPDAIAPEEDDKPLFEDDDVNGVNQAKDAIEPEEIQAVGADEGALTSDIADSETLPGTDSPAESLIQETDAEGNPVTDSSSQMEAAEFLDDVANGANNGTDGLISDTTDETSASTGSTEGSVISDGGQNNDLEQDIEDVVTQEVPVEEDDLEENFEGEIPVDQSSDTIENIIPSVNSFLSTVNDITLAVNSGWDAIPGQISAINAAIQTFQNSFAESYAYQTQDLFGETVNLTAYVVSSDVVSQVGDATASVLQTAYDRLCAFHFIYTMMELNPDKAAFTSLDSSWAKNNETALRAAVSELANLPESVWVYNAATGSNEFSSLYAAMNDGVFSGQSMVAFLQSAVQAVNYNYVLEEPTDSTPQYSTEGQIYDPNSSDYDGDDGDYGYSAEDLAAAIKEQEKNIKETELQIREAELEIKEYKKILDGKIVYATMDGIVKSAGSSSSGSNGSFITITGKEGLYVKGTVNELALDTVKVGDIITGTSYETGGTFTAEIVEISEFPEDNSNSYYGFGDENTNSSYYPFLAYIEDADGLEVDSYVDLSLTGAQLGGVSEEGTSGLSLEEYFIRTDGNGRSYCFVKGKDGLLERRYLEVGANNWGVIDVKSGLAQNDLIAFPYGDGVEEGAKTVEVESLTAVDGEDY